MATVNQAPAVATNQSQTTGPVADTIAFGALPPVQRGIVLAQTERSMGAEAASRLANGATVPDGLIGAIVRDDDVQAAVTFAGIHPERVGELKDALVAAGAKDAYHAVNTGMTDRSAIDDAQAKVAGGGCAALGDEHLLCNPEGPEIGEYTLPRQEGFPDYIGPDDWFSHKYEAEVSTPITTTDFVSSVERILTNDPTPGPGWLPHNGVNGGGEENAATPEGAINDAGLPDAIMGDQVRSYTSHDTNGNLVVSNVTIPDEHGLSPGIVSQGVRVEAGRTHIKAVGEGNGWLSKPTNFIADLTFGMKVQGDLNRAVWEDTNGR